MKGRIGGIYNALQALEIKPTPENTRILTAVYNTLSEIYGELEKEEQEHDRQESGAEPGGE